MSRAVIVWRESTPLAWFGFLLIPAPTRRVPWIGEDLDPCLNPATGGFEESREWLALMTYCWSPIRPPMEQKTGIKLPQCCDVAEPFPREGESPTGSLIHGSSSRFFIDSSRPANMGGVLPYDGIWEVENGPAGIWAGREECIALERARCAQRGRAARLPTFYAFSCTGQRRGRPPRSRAALSLGRPPRRVIPWACWCPIAIPAVVPCFVRAADWLVCWPVPFPLTDRRAVTLLLDG